MHALVVGGTGMLRGATLSLAGQYETVSVVARRAAAMAAPRIHPIAVDYRDSAALSAGLRDAIARFGPVSLCIAWIHSSVAPDAPRIVTGTVGTDPAPCRYFHVRGSAAAGPGRRGPGPRAAIEASGNILYREVVLGWVVEAGGSRWLTHDEICRGVLQAVAADPPRFIIGTVEPWSSRP